MTRVAPARAEASLRAPRGPPGDANPTPDTASLRPLPRSPCDRAASPAPHRPTAVEDSRAALPESPLRGEICGSEPLAQRLDLRAAADSSSGDDAYVPRPDIAAQWCVIRARSRYVSQKITVCAAAGQGERVIKPTSSGAARWRMPGSRGVTRDEGAFCASEAPSDRGQGSQVQPG